MKRVIVLLLVLLGLCFSVCGCAENAKEAISAPTDATSESVSSEPAGSEGSAGNISDLQNAGSLTAQAEPQTLKLPAHELTLVITNSESGSQFFYGRAYNVERKDGAEWVRVPFKADVTFYADLLSAGEKAEIAIDLNDCDFEFVSGQYRIAFPIYDTTLYAEFNVE